MIADDDGKFGEELFRASDRALYRAKALGRNQVFIEGAPLISCERQ